MPQKVGRAIEDAVLAEEVLANGAWYGPMACDDESHVATAIAEALDQFRRNTSRADGGS